MLDEYINVRFVPSIPRPLSYLVVLHNRQLVYQMLVHHKYVQYNVVPPPFTLHHSRILRFNIVDNHYKKALPAGYLPQRTTMVIMLPSSSIISIVDASTPTVYEISLGVRLVQTLENGPWWGRYTEIKSNFEPPMPSNICRSDNSLELLENVHIKNRITDTKTLTFQSVEQSHQYISHEEWCLYQLCVVWEWNRREHIHRITTIQAT